jgi:hypothetical protein
VLGKTRDFFSVMITLMGSCIFGLLFHVTYSDPMNSALNSIAIVGWKSEAPSDSF